MMKTTISRELIAASSEPLIISILNQGEDYGYSIIQKVRTCSRERIRWTDGMLYPVLHRMQDRGLITFRWTKGEGGPRRKFYRMTPAGRKALVVQREQWATVASTLDNLWEANHA